MIRPTSLALLAACLTLSACDQPGPAEPATATNDARFAGVPADGNGNKYVAEWSQTTTVTCPGGTTLQRVYEGWTQFRTLGSQVDLEVWHDTMVFTNAAGEQYVWREAGPNRYWMEDGVVYFYISGRATGDIGHLKVILDPYEIIFLNGIDGELPRFRACAALT